MSQQRQTQCVSPLTRNQEEGNNINFQMPETQQDETVGISDVYSASSQRNDAQSMITLLKTIIENQNMEFASTSVCNNSCHGHCQRLPSFTTHCHCSSQMQNPSCQQICEESGASTSCENTSITSLLKTVIKNQSIQSSCTCSLNRCSVNLRQQRLHRCREKSNSSVKQTQTVTVAQESTPNKSEISEDPSTNNLLKVILENQAKMSVQMENLVKMQEIIMNKLSGQLELVEQEPATMNRINFKRLDTVEHCQDFEDKLNNPDFLASMLRHFEPVCGNSDLKGDNVAYTLVDHVFTRRLFTLVTWSGVTRGTEFKECFFKYQRIFEFFFQLIRKTDPNYSIKSLKDFFQKIISNSKRRAETKQTRISRVKNYRCPKMRINYTGIQEMPNDDVTDYDDELKDNNSMCSSECITDDAATIQDVIIKAEHVEN